MNTPTRLLALLLFLSPPAWWWQTTGRADALFDGQRSAWMGLADEVAADALSPISPSDFSTGSARFDGEWTVGTCLMAIVGLGHTIDRFPDTLDRYLRPMRTCASKLVQPEAMDFGSTAWGVRALDEPGFRGHAYLGYIGYALGVLRSHDPEFAFAEEHDKIIDGLAAQLERRPIWALQTYPGEAYPPDQAVVLAAIAAHPGDHRVLVERSLHQFRKIIDPSTGLSYQAVRSDTGARVDGPRGSGAMFSSLWLVDASPELSRELYIAGRSELFETVLTLGAMREYPRGEGGWGDIDSGPLILGYSVSATGFAMGPAAAHGDRATFRALYRSSHLFGLAYPTTRGWRYATGLSLGNAILLAAITTRTPPVE